MTITSRIGAVVDVAEGLVSWIAESDPVPVIPTTRRSAGWERVMRGL
ncbi:hypothetical protein [Methanosphaerula palustris]|nr:hypothetical protein [Methanosphaerula palustris]